VGHLQLNIQSLQIVELLVGQVIPGPLHWNDRVEVIEQPHGVRSVEFLGDSARFKVGQGGMEPGHDDVAQPPDLVIPLGQQTQHLSMIGRLDRSEPRRSLGGDGHGQCVVRVVLVGLSGTKHSHPRSQGGRHIKDPFAGTHQLLGQQVAEPAGRLDSPGALTERLRPGQQLHDLLAGGPDFELGQLLFVTADGHSRVGRLVRVDPDDHRYEYLLRR
jgi:hypothetical protein